MDILTAKVKIFEDNIIGKINPMIFGGFIEFILKEE